MGQSLQVECNFATYKPDEISGFDGTNPMGFHPFRLTYKSNKTIKTKLVTPQNCLVSSSETNLSPIEFFRWCKDEKSKIVLCEVCDHILVFLSVLDKKNPDVKIMAFEFGSKGQVWLPHHKTNFLKSTKLTINSKVYDVLYCNIPTYSDYFTYHIFPSFSNLMLEINETKPLEYYELITKKNQPYYREKGSNREIQCKWWVFSTNNISKLVYNDSLKDLMAYINDDLNSSLDCRILKLLKGSQSALELCRINKNDSINTQFNKVEFIDNPELTHSINMVNYNELNLNYFKMWEKLGPTSNFFTYQPYSKYYGSTKYYTSPSSTPKPKPKEEINPIEKIEVTITKANGKREVIPYVPAGTKVVIEDEPKKYQEPKRNEESESVGINPFMGSLMNTVYWTNIIRDN